MQSAPNKPLQRQTSVLRELLYRPPLPNLLQFTDSDFAEAVKRNAQRFIVLFADLADDLMPEPTVEVSFLW